MNIFGVGGMELILILLIMLIVAGPKRMIHWAYILGTYTSKLRKMWEETVDYVQKEFDEAGVDVKIPKEAPTRANISRALTNAMKPVTQPVEDAISEVKQVNRMAAGNGRPADAKPAEPPPANGANGLGTWSNSATDDGQQTP